jgi:uncharacterized protein (TIGR00299 family) protein
MVLGALVDVGLPWNALVAGLKRLKLGGYRLRKRDVRRGALHAIKVDVVIQRGFHQALTLAKIRRTITASALPEIVKQGSRAVFDRLADAEGLAHGVAAHDVHFHEVGVVDSFIDVVGSVLGSHLLNVTCITASPVNVGAGTIRTAHGLLPVPGPAVAALAQGIPIYAEGPRRELTTPTGMALLRTLASGFGPLPLFESATVGYGAGDADPEGWPNALRVFLSPESSPTSRLTDRVMQIETNLDDLTPQAYDYVMDQLFAAGALDVALIPVIMKRSRPGVILSCLTPREQAEAVLAVLFKETTALGARLQELNRQLLPRRFVTVRVRGGMVRIKIADLGAAAQKAAPEYVDCKKVAEKTGRPVKNVMEEALLAFTRVGAKSRRTAL